MRGGGDRLDGLEFTETQVFKNLKAFVILVPLLRTTPHMYLLRVFGSKLHVQYLLEHYMNFLLKRQLQFKMCNSHLLYVYNLYVYHLHAITCTVNMLYSY